MHGHPAPPRRRPDGGLTLAELIAVVGVVGLLAAVAVPVFLGHQRRAHDTAVRHDLVKVGRDVASWYVDSAAAPPVSVVAGRYRIGAIDGGRRSNGVSIVVGGTAANPVLGTQAVTSGWTSALWCIAMSNPDGKIRTFHYSSSGGLGAGTCPASRSGAGRDGLEDDDRPDGEESHGAEEGAED